MTITLHRKPFSKVEVDLLVDAIMNGSCAEDWPEMEHVALEVAERLPEFLAHARLGDTSDNRRSLIRLVLLRWGLKKSRPSRSYQQFMRGNHFKKKGKR